MIFVHFNMPRLSVDEKLENYENIRIISEEYLKRLCEISRDCIDYDMNIEKIRKYKQNENHLIAKINTLYKGIKDPEDMKKALDIECEKAMEILERKKENYFYVTGGINMGNVEI